MNIKTFREFTADDYRSVVFTVVDFSRHSKVDYGRLFEYVCSRSNKKDYKLFVECKDESRLKIIRKLFPKYARNIFMYSKDSLSTLRENFFDVLYINPGENDRKFSGIYEFAYSPKTKKSIIEHVYSNDFDSFKLALSEVKNPDVIFNEVKAVFNIKNTRRNIDLPKDSIREQYIKGKIFKKGSLFAVKGKTEELQIVERKSNYIVASDGNKYFINQITPVK